MEVGCWEYMALEDGPHRTGHVPIPLALPQPAVAYVDRAMVSPL